MAALPGSTLPAPQPAASPRQGTVLQIVPGAKSRSLGRGTVDEVFARAAGLSSVAKARKILYGRDGTPSLRELVRAALESYLAVGDARGFGSMMAEIEGVSLDRLAFTRELMEQVAESHTRYERALRRFLMDSSQAHAEALSREADAFRAWLLQLREGVKLGVAVARA